MEKYKTSMICPVCGGRIALVVFGENHKRPVEFYVCEVCDNTWRG